MAQATQVTTGKVRLSYLNVFKPRAQDDDSLEKYSATLLIPKSDAATLAKITKAIEAAKELYREKNNGKSAAAFKSTLHDGDGERPSGGEYGPECKGHYVITVSSKNKPVLVYADKTPIIEETELYSGCYGRAVLNFYAYSQAGNKGISAGLNGIMKLHDGEPLAGGIITDEDWDDGWEDEADDLLG